MCLAPVGVLPSQTATPFLRVCCVAKSAPDLGLTVPRIPVVSFLSEARLWLHTSEVRSDRRQGGRAPALRSIPNLRRVARCTSNILVSQARLCGRHGTRGPRPASGRSTPDSELAAGRATPRGATPSRHQLGTSVVRMGGCAQSVTFLRGPRPSQDDAPSLTVHITFQAKARKWWYRAGRPHLGLSG